MNDDIRAPLAGTLVQWLFDPGAMVAAGAPVAIVEAMKMEHEVRAPVVGVLLSQERRVGDLLAEGEVIARMGVAQGAAQAAAPTRESTPTAAAPERPDLARLREREALTLDAARPEAVARRHALGLRTARENIDGLCDAGSFVEYGAFAMAAQTRRRPVDELMRQTPADGMVCGLGSVNGRRIAVLAYDATVLAGTQGMRNHQKADRLFELAGRESLPVVLFAEGGGGRPGDTDMPVVAGLHVPTFAALARLSGRVPLVGIAAGRCFAGNAALLGVCDLIVATRASNIGMGGPAMVEGGGLGVYKPEEIGPSDVQHANGVIDVLVENEAEAVAAARRYLALLDGPAPSFEAPPAGCLREVVPENRVRAYDSRAALEGVADAGSLLLLRTGFGLAIHTALARVAGFPVGLLASNPLHLGGAIDADAADKAARFMQLCEARGWPIVSLVDTPGFMVGPDAERRAQVRHVARLFVVAAQLSVPCFAVVMRKGYGLGAMGLAAGSFHAPFFTVAWPTGEFGAMGLEGAVRLGFRKELEAVPEGPAREALFGELLARQQANGEALNMAATLEIDAVIDPERTRDWLAAGLASATAKARVPRFIDTW